MINIVLVEPEIPQNTGNIARTCAATGASLHLIRPMGFEVDDKKLKRAGLDYWHYLDITYYDSIEEVMDKFYNGSNFYFFSTKAKKIHSEAKYNDGDKEGAKALANKYSELVRTLFVDVNPVPVKEAMNMMGLDVGECRLPLVRMSNDAQVKLRAELAKVNLI